MNRGTKITILMTGGVIVIGLIVYLVFVPLFINDQSRTNTNQNANINTPIANVPVVIPANLPPPPAEVSDETKTLAAAKTIAQTFAVRLATYSNQNNLRNLDDLRTISTPAVWSYLDNDYRDTLKKSMPPADEYYGVTSTAASVNVTMVNEGEVKAVVPMQKAESGAVSKTSYVTLDMKLKNVNGSWLVTWLEWEK